MDLVSLISKVSSETGQSKETTVAVLSSFINTVQSELKTEGKIRVPQLGKFKVHTRKSRFGRNPATGQQIVVPEKRVVKFTHLFEI